MRTLVFDLDDTLLDSHKQIRKENLLALFEAIDAGFQIVIATSRPIRAVRQFVEESLLNKIIVISLNGSVVHTPPSLGRGRIQGVIGESLIPLVAAVDSIGSSVSYSLETDGRRFATNRLFDESELWEMHSATPDMVISRETLDHSSVTKLAVDGHGSKIEGVLELAASFADLRFIPAMDNTFVNIVPLGVDKSHALREVARWEQLDLTSSFAFGDDIPDIEMFKAVGNSVAMENAKEAVKQEATSVIGHCDSDAIAFFIRESLFL